VRYTLLELLKNAISATIKTRKNAMSQIIVSIASYERELTVIVSDEGIGFDTRQSFSFASNNNHSTSQQLQLPQQSYQPPPGVCLHIGNL
jgi:anti-sigma regulatory factor (Ser/Thr protein kinase)